MKHFKIFKEHSIFEKQDIETVIKPNISYCITENHIHFIHRVKPIYLKLAVIDNQGNYIPSLQINILDNNDNVVNTIISDDEAIILENLSVNTTYHLEYVNNIDTYLVPNNITFTIDANANITTSADTYKDGNYTVLRVELQKPRIKTLAVNAADGEQLDTPPFIQLIDSKGNIIQEYENIEPYEIEELNVNEEYTLKSTVAPEGFILSQDITFTIDEHGEVASSGNTTTDEEGNTVLLIDFEMTHVSISCVDIANGEDLEGTHIQILDSEGNVAEEWTSTTETHEIKGLKTSEEYTLKTSVASEGYILATDTTFSIDEHGEVTSTGTISEEGIIMVEMQKTKVKVSSVDVADGAEVEGNHIQVLDSEGTIVEEWDSTTEVHEIEGLKTGETYTLRNTVASEGYLLATDTTFSIDEHGEVTSTGTTTEDGILLVELQKTIVKVSSVDVADGEEVGGSTIQIRDSQGNVVEEWTSTTEPHTIEGLKTGEEYTLRTTVPSDGYTVVTNNTTFTISDSGQVTSSGNTTTDEYGNTILLVEMEMVSVEIKVSCVDIANGDEVAGNTIQVIDQDGSVVDEWTSTDTAHSIEGLNRETTYTLHNTVASDGYVVATDTTFNIDNTGQITYSGETTEDENGNTVLLVEMQMTHVEISCTDLASGEELEGSTIQVIDSEGNVVEEWTSNTEPHTIEGLKTGEEYTLRNTVASEGYILATDTTFSMDETGEVTTTGNTTTDEEGNTILLVEIQKTQVQISCTDIGSGEELEGNHVQIIDSEGNIVEEWDSTTEIKLVEGLNVNEEYTLRNTVASEGYILATDTTFTIDETGHVTSTGNTTTDEEGNTILLVEVQITQVQISCTDLASGEELEGTHIQVIDSEGAVVEEWNSTEEPHIIEGLKTGETYTLNTTVATERYLLPSDNTFTIDEAGQITYSGSTTEGEDGNTILLVELVMTHVNISLVDESDGDALTDFTLQLIDNNENIIDEWVTTSDAYSIQGLLVNQQYRLMCTVAPSGYSTEFVEYIIFSIDDTGHITTSGGSYENDTLLITYSRIILSYINIKGNLIYNDSPLYANNFTSQIYVFEDEECRHPVSGPYSLTFINTNTNIIKVDIPGSNTTYYIKTVNSSDEPVDSDTINGIPYTYNIDKNVINIPNDRYSTININIVFEDIPDGFHTE